MDTQRAAGQQELLAPLHRHGLPAPAAAFGICKQHLFWGWRGFPRLALDPKESETGQRRIMMAPRLCSLGRCHPSTRRWTEPASERLTEETPGSVSKKTLLSMFCLEMNLLLSSPKVSQARLTQGRLVRICFKEDKNTDSLAVQWMGLLTSTAGGPGLIPGRGTKIPHAAQCSQKKKRREKTKILCVSAHHLYISRSP